MTDAAHAIDKQIRGAGVLQPGTPAYFDAIDQQMSRLHPGRVHSGRGDGQATEAQKTSWRKMGINMDDPKVAARMAGRMNEARERGFGSGR